MGGGVGRGWEGGGGLGGKGVRVRECRRGGGGGVGNIVRGDEKRWRVKQCGWNRGCGWGAGGGMKS